jgi:hypothetical protein
MNSVTNSLREQTRKCEVIDRKGPGREIMFVGPDTRRAIWDLIYKHGHTAQKVARMLGVRQESITATIRARVPEEIDRAVMLDRFRRGPQPPAVIARRAA